MTILNKVSGTVNMILLFFLLLLASQGSAYAGSVREKFAQELKNRASCDSIPMVRNTPVAVSIRYAVMNIQAADTTANVVLAMIWLAITWKDKNLSWDAPSSPVYHIKQMTIPTKEIWTPEIVVYNPNGVSDENFARKVVVYRDGTVNYYPQMSIPISCDLSRLSSGNSATCSLRMGSWYHPSHEVILSCPENVTLDEYAEGSRYEVLNATQSVNHRKYDCCQGYFDDAELRFTFKKK